MSEGIRVQIFRLFGGWVWSEGKNKGRHGRNVSDCHRHPLVIYNLTILNIYVKIISNELTIDIRK